MIPEEYLKWYLQGNFEYHLFCHIPVFQIWVDAGYSISIETISLKFSHKKFVKTVLTTLLNGRLLEEIRYSTLSEYMLSQITRLFK